MVNLANFLTGIRILLLPVFIIALLQDELLSAFVIFVIAGITDGLDGFIARQYKQVTQIGTYLDPLADKLLIVSSFLLLTIKDLVPSWLCVLVVMRDILILMGVIVIFIMHKKSAKIGPSRLSKANTCFQIICVIAVLGKGLYTLPGSYYQVIFWITGFLTVSSGVHYLFEWLNYLGSGQDEI